MGDVWQRSDFPVSEQNGDFSRPIAKAQIPCGGGSGVVRATDRSSSAGTDWTAAP